MRKPLGGRANILFHQARSPMAFDEKLAARIRAHLSKRRGVAERMMFGGITGIMAASLFGTTPGSIYFRD